jgi:hypothetical protein
VLSHREMSCPTLANITTSAERFFDWMTNSRNSCPGITSTQVYNALMQYDNGSANSSEISNLERLITEKTKEMNTKQKDTEIAKDRASSIIRPELHSNYYDSWFPLNRPLKRAAIPILVFFASLFITGSFFLMLDSIGIYSHFYIIVPGALNDMKGMARPFLLLLSFTVILFCITIYAFLN